MDFQQYLFFVWLDDTPTQSHLSTNIKIIEGPDWKCEQLIHPTMPDLPSISYNIQKSFAFKDGIVQVVNMMPRDWVGTDIFETYITSYTVIKQDRFLLWDRVNNWNRIVITLPINYENYTKIQVKQILNIINEWKSLSPADVKYIYTLNRLGSSMNIL